LKRKGVCPGIRNSYYFRIGNLRFVGGGSRTRREEKELGLYSQDHILEPPKSEVTSS
jgi:hypothetical protein